MTVLLLIFVSLLLTSVLSRNVPDETPDAGDLDLKLVHVVSKQFELHDLVITDKRPFTFNQQIFRHGARTPADTYPTDPYVNFDFAPFGWGQLTNVR